MVGFLARDWADPFDVQEMVYRGRFEVKRVLPGKSLGSETSGEVEVLIHDASTLGNCLGSAVVDVATGCVLGMQAGGKYLERNFAVSGATLAANERARHAGLQFVGWAGP